MKSSTNKALFRFPRFSRPVFRFLDSQSTEYHFSPCVIWRWQLCLAVSRGRLPFSKYVVSVGLLTLSLTYVPSKMRVIKEMKFIIHIPWNTDRHSAPHMGWTPSGWNVHLMPTDRSLPQDFCWWKLEQENILNVWIKWDLVH